MFDKKWVDFNSVVEQKYQETPFFGNMQKPQLNYSMQLFLFCNLYENNE